MSRRSQRTLPQRRPLEKLLPVVLAVLVATVTWRVWQHASSPERLLEQARQAMESKRYAAVEGLCQRILSGQPQSPKALLLAGEAATKQDRLTEALAF
ncbi:MAG TPA: hypothetical protein PK867_26045, partial [Pirellulales bacterium]|nr:hypothetical protein [Pirellulales bacterium]